MKFHFTIIFSLIIFSACSTPEYRERIDLAGQWQFALDPKGIGEQEQWFLKDLEDAVGLPGTTDSNQKGWLRSDTTTMHLNRIYAYEGQAWYRREVLIPENFRGRHICLFLERSRSSKLWIDGEPIGTSTLLQSPQVFDLSDVLTPGTHHITLLVNNSRDLTPYGNVHIYSDDTQTNWNGILGGMYIESSPRNYISDIRVYPDVENKSFSLELEIQADHEVTHGDIDIELSLERTLDNETVQLKSRNYSVAFEPGISLEYELGDECLLWDEFQQPLYRLTATISLDGERDSQTVFFGMRSFRARGTQFEINGLTTFLRGKHDAAVFPLSGHTPMDVEEWRRIYRIAKSYGINHYRFHSYCPPEAAFTAADLEGIYLQAELPFWGGLESDTIASKLVREGIGMLKAYANHPSFVMISPGNEIWSGHDRVEQLMLRLKEFDDRPLYAMGSNNNIGYFPPRPYCEFFVGARVPEHGDSTLGHTRLTHAFADARQGGILNTRIPSTDYNFDFAVSHMDMPLVSHEIGQYQIYPDYREISKYTGNLKAWNLEVFRKRLEEAGMGTMDNAFQQASGAWSALCYKAEMEAALRTGGMAGFQLLDLQDFPGQGTALVGILDAFMESKEVITAESWKQSCNDVVILIELPKFCYTQDEKLEAGVMIADYSNTDYAGTLDWKITGRGGEVLGHGSFTDIELGNRGLFNAGTIRESLGDIPAPGRLNIQFSLANTGYSNTYPLWLYPAPEMLMAGPGIQIEERLTPGVLSALEGGGTVLLLPRPGELPENSLAGHFPPDFWNYGMFKSISENVGKEVSPGTLGILCDPEHPLFDAFPTDYHSNWQWFSIIRAGRSGILDSAPPAYLPIVQVIDNLERNHKLGLIYEFAVGEGKILVCMSPLDRLMDRPEARQLYASILGYMQSDAFDPQYRMTAEGLTGLLR